MTAEVTRNFVKSVTPVFNKKLAREQLEVKKHLLRMARRVNEANVLAEFLKHFRGIGPAANAFFKVGAYVLPQEKDKTFAELLKLKLGLFALLKKDTDCPAFMILCLFSETSSYQ